ncbi:hypothetical protein [Maridesulfovibrio sp.]|uniref:hypothetical protein n=1 Tax=Maridesulfovibrio sp. TaxID=2795000 RepID=UPI0029C9E4A4|nr:hypothetical protein [Maridesulfovibrio sp.]
MLSFDGVATAWNALEWNFSFSIGDGISLGIALVTAWLAFLTCRIQREQKRIIEQQVRIEKVKFKRETDKLKTEISRSIESIINSFSADEVPEEEHFYLLDENVEELSYLFSFNVAALAYLLVDYRSTQQEIGRDDKKLNELLRMYIKVVEDLC